MLRSTSRKLVIPALFTVSVTIAAACGDGGGSGGSGTTTTASGPGGAGGQAAGGGGPGGSAGGGGSNPLDKVDCSARDNKKDCEAMSIHACNWTSMSCFQVCSEHMDKPSCNRDAPCMWFSGNCEMPI